MNPSASEVCDGLDNDCNALADDADPNLDVSTGTTFYADADADGYGDANATSATCVQPAGYVVILTTVTTQINKQIPALQSVQQHRR